ncbi:MAG: hypothetical protein M5U34_47475 [Chloroflexi bacterium]|nr:hypothetical protein [Chloroflexota bacterium]
MSIDRRRIYYNAVLGAMGGLFGWAFISLALRNLDTSSKTMLIFSWLHTALDAHSNRRPGKFSYSGRHFYTARSI